MSWLWLFFALELGSVPESSWVMYESQFVQPSPVLYVQFDGDVRIGEEQAYLFIGGMIRTTVQPQDGSWTFSPSSDQYLFRAGIRVGVAEIGFRHFCTHPVFPYLGAKEIITGERPTVRYEGAYDEIYVRFEGSTGK